MTWFMVINLVQLVVLGFLELLQNAVESPMANESCLFKLKIFLGQVPDSKEMIYSCS